MKHLFKRTVVLLNDFESIDNLLKKAIAFSTKHQTTLEVLYVHEEPLFDIPDYFLSEDKIANEGLDKEKVKAKIKEHLVALKQNDEHAILIYIDDTVDQVLHYAKDQKDILFITAYHEKISETLISKTPYSFWIVKNDSDLYNKIVLPIDFTDKGKEVLQASKHIFSENSMTMVHDYRYLIDTMNVPIDYLDVSPMISPDIVEVNESLKREQKKIFEAYKKEFDVEGECIEEEGSLDQDLIDYISKREFDLVVMYHQDDELFLSPSLILTLLKSLSIDFFVFNI
jgi:nucleotide-binding universal stress UspA family protein